MDEKTNQENRIGEALALRGMKQVELCEKTGLKSNAVTAWVKQKWQPKQTPLHLMAKALDVSEFWLAGFDVPMERSEKQKEVEKLNDMIDSLTNDSQCRRIMEYILYMNKEKKDFIEQMLKGLKDT